MMMIAIMTTFPASVSCAAARGTASIAVLYIPYRENFRPEVQTPYLGFRVVARPVP